MEIEEQIVVNGNAYQLASFLDGGFKEQLFALIRDLLIVFGNQGDVPQAVFDAVLDAQTAEDQAKQALTGVQTAMGNAQGIIDTVSQSADVVAGHASAASQSRNQAEGFSSQAQSAKTDAQASVVLAQAAQALAELARDSAGAGGSEPYATEAAGRAAVADGVVFKALSGGNTSITWYRRTNATTSVTLASIPSTQYVSETQARQARQSVTYANLAAGLAAVAVGEEFLIKGSGSASEIRHKKLSATTSQELSSNAATAAVQALQGLIAPTGNSKRAFNFVDRLGFVIASIFSDGLLQTRALQLDGSDAAVIGGKTALAVHDRNGFIPISFDALQSNLYGMSIRPSKDGSIALVDRNGFVLFYVGPRGIIGTNTAAAVETVPSAVSAVKLGAQVRTDVIHAACFGQSLSRGLLCDAISLAQLYGNLMLSAGVKALPGEAAYNPAAFAPLVESVVGDEGETPVAGALNGLVRRVVSGGGVAEQWVFLGSSSGKGGQQVEQLSPGGNSGRFEQTLQIIRDAKALCETQGKTYSVWAMHWYQGENNYSATASDRDAFDYQQRWLTKLWQTMQAEILRITGQQFLPYLFTYQVAAHRRYAQDHIQIALAQWRASKAYDDVVLTAPCYIFRTNADNLHLTAESSWLMGEYTSRAMHQTMIRRSGKWRPLEPIAADWSGQEIKVKFHVPAGQLVIDNALAATYENAGFILRNGADAVIAGGITAVAVTARDEITITTAPGIPFDAKLTYARGKPGDAAHSGPISGGRGNVRDTAGLYDKATSPLGNEFALHNACVMFEYSRAVGF